MMKKIKNIITVIIIALFATNANAQKGELKMSLNYNYSMPVSGFKNDIVNKASPRGFNGSIMYSFHKNWSAGLDGGFQDYYQKYSRDVYDLDKNQQISAVLSNSVQTTPVLAKIMFNPLQGQSFIQPYVSGAAGMSIVNFTQYLGEFGGTDNSVSFAAQGSAGFKIPFGKFNSSGLSFGVNYNYVPYKRNGYNDLNTFDLNAGIYFHLK